jgi:hypothetical protein
MELLVSWEEDVWRAILAAKPMVVAANWNKNCDNQEQFSLYKRVDSMI